MPKLWTETIETHRRAVRDAILDSAWALVTEHGLTAVTMSQIAAAAGIGRATLYKHFPDIEAILAAWHERRVAGHLAHLTELSGRPGDATARLERVLEAYALMAHRRGGHGAELGALLHRGEHVHQAQRQLDDLIRDLLAAARQEGGVRGDVAPAELAAYCLNAVTAARDLPSEAAVRRLVGVVLAGLAPG